MSEIRVENIIGETGVDAVQFTKGINTTETLTSTNVSVASSVTASTFYGNGAGITGVTSGALLRKSMFDPSLRPKRCIGKAKKTRENNTKPV